MTAGELRAWKERHGLTVAELAWIAGRSVRTIERKLSGEIAIRHLAVVTECYDLMIAHGIRPPRWPADLGPHPTAIRRRQRRRRFRLPDCIGRLIGYPPKRQAESRIFAVAE